MLLPFNLSSASLGAGVLEMDQTGLLGVFLICRCGDRNPQAWDVPSRSLAPQAPGGARPPPHAPSARAAALEPVLQGPRRSKGRVAGLHEAPSNAGGRIRAGGRSPPRLGTELTRVFPTQRPEGP